MEQKSREPILRNRVCTDPVPLNISHHEDITWYTKIRKYYLVDADVESWGDDTTLVQTTVQFNDNLASSVVIDDFEFTNVSVFHHNLKKLDDDLKRFFSWRSIKWPKSIGQKIITLEAGLIKTCLLPRFSALQIFFKASANTFMRTMVTSFFIRVLKKIRI